MGISKLVDDLADCILSTKNKTSLLHKKDFVGSQFFWADLKCLAITDREVLSHPVSTLYLLKLRESEKRFQKYLV